MELASDAVPLTQSQRDTLDRLTVWAEGARNKPDSKAKAILEWIESHLKEPDGQWNNKRVILYTEYRATHSWLQQILASHGYGGDRLAFLHGDVDPDDRETVKAAFQADPAVSPVRILLATDAASEGIDLQNHCTTSSTSRFPGIRTSWSSATGALIATVRNKTPFSSGTRWVDHAALAHSPQVRLLATMST